MSLSLLASTPGNAEASQIIGTLNSVINQINNSTLAVAAGSGAINLAIFLAANSTSVNLLSITSGGSSSPLILTVGGSSADTNQDFEILAIGTGRTLIGGTSSGAPLLVLNATASVANQALITGGSSGSNLWSLVAQGSDTSINLSISGKGASGGVLLGGANSLLAPLQIVQATASVADFLKITGGSSGQNLVSMVAGGSDSNINVSLGGTGTGGVILGGATTLLAPLQIVQATASVADFLKITGGSSGQALVTIATAGSDTNIDFALATAGSGLLRFNNTTNFTANSNVALSITALGPAALISSTISKWLTVKDSAGGLFYIPCFH